MKKRMKKFLIKELLIIVAGLTAYAAYVNKDTMSCPIRERKV